MIDWFRKPTAVETAQTAVQKATERRDRLATQLTDTQGELAALKAGAAQAAHDGQDVDEWGSSTASQSATVDALTDALDTAQCAVADAEQALAEAVDCQARERSIATISNIAQDIDGRLQTFLEALDNLASAVRAGARVSLDCQSLAGFLELTSVELPTAGQAALKGLRHHVKLIELRSASPRLPSAEQMLKPIAINMPAVKTIVTLYASRYVNPRNNVARTCGRGVDVELSEASAQRCVAAGVGLWEHDEHAMQVRRDRDGRLGRIHDVIDLDDPNVSVPKPPQRSMRPDSIAAVSASPDERPSTWMAPHAQPTTSGESF